jgi:membrane-anchored protein YejM (alkaline phosphatase superfamily)
MPSPLKSVGLPLVAFLWLNLLLLCANALGYAQSLATADRAVALYLYFGLFCQMSVLTLIVGASVLPLPYLGRRVFWVGASLAAATAHFVVLIDHTLYGLFQFHINLLVLNVISNIEGIRSLGVETSEYLIYAVVFAVIFVVELALLRVLLNRLSARPFRLAALHLVAQTAVLAVVLRLLPSAFEDGEHPDFYAAMLTLPWMDATFLQRPNGTHFGIAFLDDLGSAAVAAAPSGAPARASFLKYPKRPLTFREGTSRPDLLIIVVDSLRYDALTPEVMPNVHELGARATTFTRHYSGGNSTRFGIFSLFYGLPGTRWWEFLSQRQSPALLDSLAARGYDQQFYAGASFRWPEFNDFLFANVPAAQIHDEYRAFFHKHRDREMTKDVKAYLRRQYAVPAGDRPPYLAFVFYDSTHYPYVFPDGAEVFTPSLAKLYSQRQYLEANKDALVNRYKNAVRSVDGLIGSLLEEIPPDGPAPLIVVTGDHGEAFGENGRWEHASDFSDVQIRVPLVVALPEAAPDGGAVVDRVTSHAQLVPTLLEAAGVENPASDYASQPSLFAAEGSGGTARPLAVSCGWGECALVKDAYQVQFSTHIESGTFGPRWLGADYAPRDPTDAERRESLADLAVVLKSLGDYRR